EKRLVLGRIVRRGIVEAGDQAERGLAHRLQHAVVGEIAGGDDADAGLLETAFLVTLDERDRLAARRKKDEDRFRPGVLDALQERREVGIDERRPDAVDDLATRSLERLDKRRLGVDA